MRVAGKIPGHRLYTYMFQALDSYYVLYNEGLNL